MPERGWRLIGRLLTRLRPAEGWGTVFALLLGVLFVTGAVENAHWLRRAPSFYAPVVLAVLAGITAARLVRRGWWATALLAGSGLVVGIITAARAWPPFLLIMANLRHLAFILTRPEQTPPDIVLLPPWMLDRLQTFFGAIAVWRQGVTNGQAGAGPQVVSLTILLILWAATSWAGWSTFRHHRALLALAPAGFVLASNNYFASLPIIWLAPFMLALVILAVRLRQYRLETGWKANNVDYSREFRLELYLSGLFVAAAVAGIMLITPNVHLSAISNAFWDIFSHPYNVLEARVERFLPELDRSPRSLVDQGVTGGGGLPRSHLIGDPPELSERLVMAVSTSDADPVVSGSAANYRWRGVTFSAYNGHGWENPADTTIERFSPGEVWLTQSWQGRRSLRQVFEIAANRPFWLYGVGEPVAADRPFQAHLRGLDDAVGFEAEARDYTIISEMPDVTESDLRSAPPATGSALTPYLDLPDSTPDRVLALAADVTTAADTPYDQAKALESYLRTYPYDLDVPQPPTDVDIADYFLFDLQRGYCDYYATSMVVMARSLGLPARLAVGYAAGEYDEQRQRFTVVEADAHSWPEIYFTDYGWIPFEPTAAQPVYVRQPVGIETQVADGDAADLASQLAQLRRQAWLLSGVWRWALLLALPLLLILAVRTIWRDWRLRQRAANPWQLAYLHLERWGNRLDVTPAPWLTPHEYAQRWRSRLVQGTHPPDSAQAAADDIDQLSEALERRAYAPASAQPSDVAANPLWRQLRSKLRRLRWQRRFR